MSDADTPPPPPAPPEGPPRRGPGRPKGARTKRPEGYFPDGPPMAAHRRRTVRENDQVGDPFFARLGLRVRAARLKAGMSVKELADESNMGDAELTHAESNKVPIKLIYLRAISRVLGVPMAQWFARETEDADDISPIPLGEEPWAWRVTAKDEQKLLHNYRGLRRREKRITHLMIRVLVRARDDRWKSPEEKMLERKMKLQERKEIDARMAAARHRPWSGKGLGDEEIMGDGTIYNRNTGK